MTIEIRLEDILHNEYYNAFIPKIKEDILYSMAIKTNNHLLLLPQDILKRIKEEDGYSFNSIKDSLNKEELSHLDSYIISDITSFYICHENFDLSYEDFKYIKQTDISKLKFSDDLLKNFIINIKQIQNGNYQIFSAKINNPKERLLNEFKNEINSNLINSNNLNNVENKQLTEYGLPIPNDVTIKDSGLNFTMIIKDMGFAGRIGDTFKEKWNQDESNFRYDSRSLVSNSIFTSISTPKSSQFAQNWMVGFNNIRHLNDASSADLANNTVDGKLETYLKPGKNVKNLCTTQQLLATTGLMQDDNTQLFDFNEIVCNKYDEIGTKYKPDYIIFTVSTNQNSKFSKNINERFQIAQTAAKDFNIPIVFVDLDKIVKHEKETVDQKITEYKENPSNYLLEDILTQIRMNRTTDYANELFTDEFISNFIIQSCNEENKEVFENMINLMPNYSFNKLQNEINRKNRIINEIIEKDKETIIKKVQTIEEIKGKINPESLEKLTQLQEKIDKKSKKFFKNKKVKKEIEEAKLKLETLKKELIEKENARLENEKKEKLKLEFEKKNININVNEDLEKQKKSLSEQFDFCYNLSYERNITIPKINDTIIVTNLLESERTLQNQETKAL